MLDVGLILENQFRAEVIGVEWCACLREHGVTGLQGSPLRGLNIAAI